MNPGDDAIWDKQAIGVHKLTALNSRIANTDVDAIAIVWKQFNMWIDRHTSLNDIIVLVDWNGGTCDLN